MNSQLASWVLMVRPGSEIGAGETGETNAFESGQLLSVEHAQAEFDHAVEALREAGVGVLVHQSPSGRDAVFPNNWVSFHPEKVVLYPMYHPSRRLERRLEWIEPLLHGRQLLDLTAYEAQGKALEGTGSLVLDRERRIAYACLSPRTDADVLQIWAEAMGYQVELFCAEHRGMPVYHTNVLMSIGQEIALVATSLLSGADSALGRLRQTHQIVEISADQVDQFAGNALQVIGSAGPLWVMSATAEASLTPDQRALLQPRVCPPIPGIERAGGGSIRCMMLEVFGPR